MSFPAYPEYKDSGIEWLGEVPAGWTIKRLGSQFAERRETVNDTDFPPLSVTKRGIVPQLETAAKTDSSDNRKRVAVNDFVINSRSDRKNSAGVSFYDGSVSLINTVLEPREAADPAFIHFLLRTTEFAEEFYRYGHGIVADLWTTRYSEMKAIMLAMPPLEEQRTITAFLDRETARIDAAVAAQERLIALLAEKRAATISHAVTKGLDPNAPMKDSGIEGLGEIPAHWKLAKLGRIIEGIEQGWSPNAYDRDPDEDEASVLRLSAVKDGKFRPAQRKALPDISQEELRNAPKLAGGDFLLTRANTPELVGDCAIANYIPETIFSDLIYRLTFSSSVSKDFVLYMLRSAPLRGQIRSDARGASMTMAKLSHRHIKSWLVPLPPPKEQIDIANWLSKKLAELDQLVERSSGSVSLLQERRAALVSAAVTGKIDVRGEVAAAAQEAA